jgi:hypothetical protein
MIVILATVASLCLWIILWAIGAKGFDAFLPTFVIVLTAVIVQVVLSYLPSRRQRD